MSKNNIRVFYKFKSFLLKYPIVYKFALYLYKKIRNNPFGTHQFILKRILKNFQKQITIVEVGSGLNSSRIFADFAKKKNHFFYSFETNKDFFFKINRLIKNENGPNYCINFKLVDTYDEVKKFKNHIDLLFIDSSPWTSRVEMLDYFKKKAKIIIIHDCDYFPNNKIFGTVVEPFKNTKDKGYRNYDDVFKSWYEYFPEKFPYKSGPPTLVGSNIVNVSEYV
jgi:hypothetical protein